MNDCRYASTHLAESSVAAYDLVDDAVPSASNCSPSCCELWKSDGGRGKHSTFNLHDIIQHLEDRCIDSACTANTASCPRYCHEPCMVSAALLSKGYASGRLPIDHRIPSEACLDTSSCMCFGLGSAFSADSGNAVTGNNCSTSSIHHGGVCSSCISMRYAPSRPLCVQMPARH
jgi:hypothetical protein